MVHCRVGGRAAASADPDSQVQAPGSVMGLSLMRCAATRNGGHSGQKWSLVRQPNWSRAASKRMGGILTAMPWGRDELLLDMDRHQR